MIVQSPLLQCPPQANSQNILILYLVIFLPSKKSLCCGCCGKSKEYEARTIYIGDTNKDVTAKQKYSKNVVRNQKYSVFSFIPVVSVSVND